MQIQVQINEEGALRNQRYAFTDRFTLVSELLQNARRAGATRIEIDYDAATQMLRVQDDGCGLDDFQKLLSFHESGWDAATTAEERPFGVGFSKCLYAATRCIVASNHQRVDLDTAAALAKASIEVEPIAEAVTGTRIELHGVDLPDLGNRIETLCLGFPVQVLFNGKPLTRRFAAANLATMASPMGTVHLTGTRDGKFSYNTMVFLQGFCVMKPNYCPFDEVNIVHLDSRQFMARLPDRDKLIDEDVQRKRIDTELKACWLQTLEVAKAQLSPERFVAIYYAAMRAWGHWDLLNDLDVLPAELFDGSSTIRSRTTTEAMSGSPAPPAAKVAVTWCPRLLDDDNAARWMLARPWLSGLRLDRPGSEHWACHVASWTRNGAGRSGVRTGPVQLKGAGCGRR